MSLRFLIILILLLFTLPGVAQKRRDWDSRTVERYRKMKNKKSRKLSKQMSNFQGRSYAFELSPGFASLDVGSYQGDFEMRRPNNIFSRKPGIKVGSYRGTDLPYPKPSANISSFYTGDVLRRVRDNPKIKVGAYRGNDMPYARPGPSYTSFFSGDLSVSSRSKPKIKVGTYKGDDMPYPQPGPSFTSFYGGDLTISVRKKPKIKVGAYRGTDMPYAQPAPSYSSFYSGDLAIRKNTKPNIKVGLYKGNDLPVGSSGPSAGTLFEGSMSPKPTLFAPVGYAITGMVNSPNYRQQNRKRTPNNAPNPLIGAYKGNFFSWAFSNTTPSPGSTYTGNLSLQKPTQNKVGNAITSPRRTSWYETQPDRRKVPNNSPNPLIGAYSGSFYPRTFPKSGKSQGTTFSGKTSTRKSYQPYIGNAITSPTKLSWYDRQPTRKKLPKNAPNPLISTYSGSFYWWAFPYPSRPNETTHQGNIRKRSGTSTFYRKNSDRNNLFSFSSGFNLAARKPGNAPNPFIGTYTGTISTRNIRTDGQPGGTQYKGELKRSPERRYAPMEGQYTERYISINLGLNLFPGPEIGEFTGNRSSRINARGDLHPSFRYSNAKNQSEVKQNITKFFSNSMNWLFKNSDQPPVVKRNVRKPRYDKREAEIWYD